MSKEKTVACIIARTNSTRLPEKVLLEVNGFTMIEHIINRMKKIEGIDKIYIATSLHPDDQILVDIAERNNIESYCGSETSVIDRMLDIAKIEDADNVIRITGDNVFTDPYILEKLIIEHNTYAAEYSRVEGLSIGVTAEVIDVSALQRCYEEIDPDKSEYLFLYMFDPDKYRTLVLLPNKDRYIRESTSLTVDTLKDFERTKYIFDNITSENEHVSYKDIVDYHNGVSDIPHFVIEKSLSIKLPDNKTISYDDFKKDIVSKVRRSILKLIEL